MYRLHRGCKVAAIEVAVAPFSLDDEQRKRLAANRRQEVKGTT
jgi:hypothetical protein